MASCKECTNDQQFTFDKSTERDMRQHSVCHSCLWLIELIQLMKIRTNIVIFNHQQLTIGNENASKSYMRGCAGRKFCIVMSNDDKIITTNLWYGLGIPSHFYNRLPNNVTSLTEL